MKIFRKLNMLGEAEEERDYYSHENFNKWKIIRRLNTEINELETRVNELEKENEQLKEQNKKINKKLERLDKNGKNTRTKHNTRKPSVSRTRSK